MHFNIMLKGLYIPLRLICLCLCLKGDTDTTLFQVKMINYIRRCVHLNTCLQCGDIFPDQVTMMMMMMIMISAANRLIGEVAQSLRRPLLGPY